MNKIGRNDPCPCGSRKKYKQCCLNQVKPLTQPGAGLYSQADRTSALRKLLAFAGQDEFATDRAFAAKGYWADLLTGRTEEEIRMVKSVPQTEVMFNAWLLFDLTIEPERTFTDLFLAREGARLTTGERTYVEQAKATFPSLYEVADVRSNEGLSLRELWTGRQIRVRERLATRTIAQWDIIAARLMRQPDGEWELEAGAFQYPPHLKGELLTRMKREHSRLSRRSSPPGDSVGFLKRIGMLFNQWWLQDVVFRPMPTVVTAEGDPFIFTKVLFDVLDHEGVLAALQACLEMHHVQANEFDWVEQAAPFQRSLGTIRLDKGKVILETASQERAERGRRLLETAAGSAIRYRVTAYEDMAHTLERARQLPQRKPPKALPPEVEAEALRQYYDRHYRAWLDKPIPLFGGRTPRHAARLKSQRANVVATLKSMENSEAHATREGRPVYDFTWLWQELGLERKE